MLHRQRRKEKSHSDGHGGMKVVLNAMAQHRGKVWENIKQVEMALY